MRRNNGFAISRQDGRTNAEVLIGLVQQAEPGRVFSYDELRTALAEGSTAEWTIKAIQGAVRASRKPMLRSVQRTLYPVTGVGYRLSHGSEHSSLAVRAERRASNQVKSAMELLKNVAWAELSPTQRTMHEAHLTITGAMFVQLSAVTRRQKKHDEAIQNLLTRVDKLEQHA